MPKDAGRKDGAATGAVSGEGWHLTRQLLAFAHSAAIAAIAIVAVALLSTGAGFAFQLSFEVLPATFSPAIAKVREQPPVAAGEPELSTALLEAYVERQKKLRAFDGFDAASPSALTEDVLLGYIARQRNEALEAIGIQVDHPDLTASMLEAYARDSFVPTVKKVRRAKDETLCLTQAIYYEARGESETGQWAVANVIINRALSKRFPATLCGVVFQNADRGRYECQFTFACDGRPDIGTERRAWARAARLAETAYRDFAAGKRPGVLPSSALYYHTTSVAPKWSYSFRRVAAIGAHIFYAPL